MEVELKEDQEDRLGEILECTNLKTYDRVKRTAGDRVGWKSMVVDLLMKMTDD